MTESRIGVVRRVEFDAGHRILNHESKCGNLHGHRYVVEIHATAKGLDDKGRVIDFSVLKTAIGGWLDANWDHTLVLWEKDVLAIEAAKVTCPTRPAFLMATQPTAENMAAYLQQVVCPMLLNHYGITVTKVVVWETPNCRAIAEGGE